MTLRALALDFGDTLAVPGPGPDGHTVLEVLRRMPGTDVPDTFVAAFEHVHRITREGDRVRDTHTAFADEIRHAAALCGARVPHPEAVVEPVFEHIPDSRVIRRAAEALRRIRDRRDLVCVLACDTQRPESVRRRTLAEAGIEACFDAVVLSSTIGLRKPNPQFYAEVERACGNIAREQIMFVGNTPTKDATAPHVYGMQAVLIAPTGRPTGLAEAIGVIDHFADLPDYLDRAAAGEADPGGVRPECPPRAPR
ncbi:HAD family hydrolase [Embleya scabrispora]|uniref:HAD family hydrolase n=1 Tax=Embleya scabrispora TaxID=159449 RepID=UPI001319D1D4|nr:HAD family hydrolase [Embleya scabrispora]MYS83698.1 HAD hydrolase-like protein [Streptomyces sp. SID5474]